MTVEAKTDEDTGACCSLEGAPWHEHDGEGTERVSQMASAFKALSDGTRLRILRTLLKSPGPVCECEIVPLFGLSQPTISYHLKVLREAGLVEVERRGVWGYYRVEARALLGLVRELTEIGS